jgi:hypothetical protein
MRLEFECVALLPRLAWCARLTAGSEAVRIVHGPWVEILADGFCEGAWDVPFEEGRFADASTFAGTGGRLAGDGVLFATSTNLMSRLYSIRDGARLLVSNSMVFLLAEAGDALDLGHAHYYFDFLRHKRRGLTRTTESIRTAAGNRLFLHQYTNVLVRSDLSFVERRKSFGSPPADFADYRDMLRSGVAGVFANAAHAGRRRTYRPLATLSQGYDAPAVAALAVEAGCTEALTGVGTFPKKYEERGARVGPYLGLDVIEYDRFAFQSSQDVLEAEFCASMAFGSYVPLSVLGARLEGTVLVTGHPGDDIWTTDARKVLPELLAPGDQLLEGTSLAEFRLRVGFVHFAPAWTGAFHKHALHRISTSAEMRAWSVPGRYDRPIPRRIAEEAGVPRDLFGQVKVGTLPCTLDRGERMSPRGRSEFEAFAERLPRRPGSGLGALAARIAGTADKVAFECLRRAPQGVYMAYMPVALRSVRDRTSHLWRSIHLFTFHWGVERIRSRYSID